MPNFILNAFQGEGECCESCEDVVLEDCGCGDFCPECNLSSYGTVVVPYGFKMEFYDNTLYETVTFVWQSDCTYIPCGGAEGGLPVWNYEFVVYWDDTFETFVMEADINSTRYIFLGDGSINPATNLYTAYTCNGPAPDTCSSNSGPAPSNIYAQPEGTQYDCLSDARDGGLNCTNCPNMIRNNC